MYSARNPLLLLAARPGLQVAHTQVDTGLNLTLPPSQRPNFRAPACGSSTYLFGLLAGGSDASKGAGSSSGVSMSSVQISKSWSAIEAREHSSRRWPWLTCHQDPPCPDVPVSLTFRCVHLELRDLFRPLCGVLPVSQRHCLGRRILLLFRIHFLTSPSLANTP